jgi:UPF0716 protein FxsA
MPKDQLLDGGLLLVGAATLLTPGLLTDTLGFLLIIPFTRPLMRKIVKDHILSKFLVSHNLSGRDYDNYQQQDNKREDEEEIIDITDYEEIDEDDE